MLLCYIQQMICYQHTLLLCCCFLTRSAGICFISVSLWPFFTEYIMCRKLLSMACKISLRVDLVVTTVMTRSWFVFHFSIQRLPLSQAIVLSFTTPIMASIAARIILHEKLKIADIGGMLVCNSLYCCLLVLYQSNMFRYANMPSFTSIYETISTFKYVGNKIALGSSCLESQIVWETTIPNI